MDDLKFIDLCSLLELDGVDFNRSSLRSLDRDHLKELIEGRAWPAIRWT